MAAVLERHPRARVTANFSGVLLEQLNFYLDGQGRDYYWDLSAIPAPELGDSERQFITHRFFSLDRTHVLARFPRFAELLAARATGRPLSNPELQDLQVLFNLAWCGFTLRSQHPVVRRLVAKQHGFSHEDSLEILGVHRWAMGEAIQRWKTLIENGNVELSSTPHNHPILPLIIDTQSARRCMPTHKLPTPFRSPLDAEWQVNAGLAIAEEVFGVKPQGMWPAEGSVSPEAVATMARAGVRWLASDEAILASSKREARSSEDTAHQAWFTPEGPAVFFRDHELSDLIGFSYSNVDPKKAADDFVGRLHSRAERGAKVISVILDGENAWEHFPNDGEAFLDRFYEAIENAEGIDFVTPSRSLPPATQRAKLRHLGTGSWIDGNFRIWIGSPEKNAAWELLNLAKRCLGASEADSATRDEAHRFLARAEGSDWMWWYGDDNQSDEDDLFDYLFRANVRAVFETLHQNVPEELAVRLVDTTRTSQHVKPKNAISPAVDGSASGYFQWLGSGSLPNRAAGTSMATTSTPIREIRYGFDKQTFYLRLALDEALASGEREHRVTVRLQAKETAEVVVKFGERGPIAVKEGEQDHLGEWQLGFSDFLDIAVPLKRLGASIGDQIRLGIELSADKISLVRLPLTGGEVLVAGDGCDHGHNWIV